MKYLPFVGFPEVSLFSSEWVSFNDDCPTSDIGDPCFKQSSTLLFDLLCAVIPKVIFRDQVCRSLDGLDVRRCLRLDHPAARVLPAARWKTWWKWEIAAARPATCTWESANHLRRWEGWEDQLKRRCFFEAACGRQLWGGKIGLGRSSSISGLVWYV